MKQEKVVGNRIRNHNWILIVSLLFIGSTIMRSIWSDFPKALRIYPDELRYVSIANSLIHGRGLQIHNMDSDFQKILYSLCIIPAFWAKSSAMQIRIIGYINSIIVSSSVFPVYMFCQKIKLKDKEIGMILAFWITFPTLLVSMYFMSEVIYLPLSLWVVYFVWSALDADRLKEKICVNFILGILCYLAYLCKEIALYFILAYLFVCICRIFTRQIEWRREIICLSIFVGIFMLCFWGMKRTLFYGMKNSYSSFNLSNIKGLNLLNSPNQIKYLLYSFVYDTLFAILGFGVVPVLFPLCSFHKNKKESWFYLFLLIAFLIGCATIAFTITLPEELGTRSPRQHLRYLEPFAIPFYIFLLNNIRQENISVKWLKLSMIHIILFVSIFIVLGAGGGSSIVDNSMLIYYEFFARFICKSDTLLLFIRILMALVLCIGVFLIYKNKEKFVLMFGVVFIIINIINSLAGYFACIYRYTIDEEQRIQASEANDYLWAIPGSILLITDEGWESEDSRLFDTYINRDFYVAEIDMIAADGSLEDSVLDLQTESIKCNFPYKYYSGLTEIDYLIVKDDYNICFQNDSVEEMIDFPMEGYKMYRNKEQRFIRFANK